MQLNCLLSKYNKCLIGQNEFEQSFKVQAKEANFWGGKKLIFLQTPKKADPTNFCLIVVEIKCSQLAVNFPNVSLLIIWNSGGSISTAQWFFFASKWIAILGETSILWLIFTWKVKNVSINLMNMAFLIINYLVRSRNV